MRALLLDSCDRTAYTSRLAASLAAAGIEMHYAGDPRHKDFDALEARGVQCHALRVRHKLDFPTRGKLRALLDRHRIEIVETIAGREAYVALRVRGGRKVRVFAQRGAYPRISRWDPADRVVYGRRGANRIVVISKDLERHMVSRGIRADRLKLIYLGIWSEELAASVCDLRAEYSIPADRFLLAMVGQHRPVKGFEYLLDALALLDRRGLPFHLLVAGGGYERRRPEVQTRGLEGRVSLLGFLDDPLRVTANVDCVIVPSRIDSLPRAAIEATVLGTPVIGTRVGGIPEILDEGRAGRLVDPEKPGEMAEAIENAIRRPGSLERLAEVARLRNRELFSIQRCTQAHLDLYQEA